MCIFSGPVSHVSGTKIMISAVAQSKIVTIRDKYGKTKRVRRAAEGTQPLQLTVYSNTVSVNGMGEPTAMILPFPLIKGKNRVQIMDLSKNKNMFKNLDKLFKSKRNKELIMQNALEYFDDADSIAVRNVGSYTTSIVPNFASFDKLQYNAFGLSADVKNLLKQYYAKEFGFIVCILRQDAEYHPFGYTHEIRADGKLFVPTRHFHGNNGGANPFVYNEAQTRLPDEPQYDDGVDEIDEFMQRTISDTDPYLHHTLKHGTVRDVPDVDWDHSVYVINYSRILKDLHYKREYMEVKAADPGRLYNIDKYFDTTQFPGSIILPKITSVQRLNIFPGYKNNHDLLI